MPDRPSPFAEDTKPSTKDAEAAHSRLAADSQSQPPEQKNPELKAIDEKPAGVPPWILYSSDYQPLVIPPFSKLNLHSDHGSQTDKNDDWRERNRSDAEKQEKSNIDKNLDELVRKEWEKPFTSSQPLLLISSGLCPYSIGVNSSGFFGALNRGLGAGVLTGLGAWQASKDYHNLLNSDSTQGTFKYGTALAMDASIVSGGALSFAKYGPRWLAPTLLIGGVAGRMALDLIPNRR